MDCRQMRGGAWRRNSLAALLCVAMSTPAMARQVALPESLDEALQPDFIRRDLRQFQSFLKLDQGQTIILESLYGDYETAFREGADSVRQQINRLRPAIGHENPETEERRDALRERLAQLLDESERIRNQTPEDGNPSEYLREFQKRAESLQREMRQLNAAPLSQEQIDELLEQAAARAAEWQARKNELRKQFIDDVQAMLTAEQQPAWPALERKLVREKSLPRGRLSGESADLFLIVNEALPGAEHQEAISHTLQAYDIRLDRALRERDEYIVSSQPQQLEATHARDAATAQAIIQRQFELREIVRNVNDEFAQQIAAGVPAERGPAFLRTYHARAYPRVFRTTQVQRLFNSASELSSLDAATAQSLADLRQAYQAELALTNERLLQTVRTHEPGLMSGRLGRATALGDDPATAAVDPISEAFSRRIMMDHRYAQQLRAVLPADQFARLPGSGDFLGNQW